MRTASLLVVAGGLFSCTYDIPDVVPRPVDAGLDSSMVTDGFVFDERGSGDGGGDATTDGPGPTVYNDMTSAANWTTFDTSSVTVAANSNPQVYMGGTFDGRYVYLAPSTYSPASSVVLQYDTTGSFADKAAWAPFDTEKNVSSVAGGYGGASYDGQFVYFTPLTLAASPQSAADGFVTRFDSKQPFGSTGAWSGFNATGLNAGAEGFEGAAFDGRYIYFAPDFAGSSTASGLVARYDTQGGFNSGAAWTFFNALGFNSQAAGFLGAVFDGRYVTFVPAATTVAVRYDTQGSFIDQASWFALDLAGLTGSTMSSFAGGVFDGSYVYLVPGVYNTFNSVVARCDAKLPFSSCWKTFDLAKVDANAKGFGGGAFDGRYVYFIPQYGTVPMAFSPSGLIVRYDTTQAFDQAPSWSKFDLTTLGSHESGFFGAVFDGRYLYLVPWTNSYVARFDARTPAQMPGLPAFHGSFL